jgi:hypothetical protein
MTTPGLPSSNATALSVAAQNSLSKTTLGIFTLGALGFTAWRMQDAYVGSKQKADEQISTLKVDNDYRLTEYSFGQYSGNPGMDNLALKFDALRRYGPFRLREHFQSAKIRINNFFNNVIGPNLLPLGIGLAGVYSTIGHEQMAIYGNNIATWWSRTNFLDSQAWRTLRGVGNAIGSGLWNIIKTPVQLAFRSPQHFAIASGITLVGAFFIKRFSDNVNGNAQQDFYRDELFP